MNRIFGKSHSFQGFPHNLPEGTQLYAMEFQVPTRLEDLDKSVESFCRVFYESCRESKVALSSLMYGFVQPEGAMPHLCQQVACGCGVDPNKMAIAILVCMGCKFAKFELEQAKNELRDLKLEPGWFDDQYPEYSFSSVLCKMTSELTCDCPACVMFWSGRQYITSEHGNMEQTVKKLCEFLKKCQGNERGKEGCVEHLVPKAGLGKWCSPDDPDFPQEG